MKQALFIMIICVMLTGLTATTLRVSDYASGLELISADPLTTRVEIKLGELESRAVFINNVSYTQLYIKNESNLYNVGEPALPKFTRSMAISANAGIQTTIIEAEYVDLSMQIAPSRGLINRDETDLPYIFGEAYSSTYPDAKIWLGEPYIMRNVRGITFNVCPFEYNHATQTLRVYTRLLFELSETTTNNVNVLASNNDKEAVAFDDLYRQHFINYATASRYERISEQGKLLVICPQIYVDTIDPYIKWKRQKGMQVELCIKEDENLSNGRLIYDYVLNKYTEDPSLAYLQLVGDYEILKTMVTNNYPSDPTFSLLVGQDNYPDIFVGRFSCETREDLVTQVERTIYYEKHLNETDTWLDNAMTIASLEGDGEGDEGQSDIDHMRELREKLLDYGYSFVDRLFADIAPTADDVSAGINIGRGAIYYAGHGNVSSWVTTRYGIANINELQNVNKLPYVMSVACSNGRWIYETCFGEAWLRARHNNEPTGAIATYMSSINVSWAPPMEAQDETVRLIESDEAITLGSLWYHASCQMMDNYGVVGANSGALVFDTWHIFGDASLQHRTRTPRSMQVSHPVFIRESMQNIHIATGVPGAAVCLTGEYGEVSFAYADNEGDVHLALENLPSVSENLFLTVTAFNYVTYTARIFYSSQEGPFIVVDEIEINCGGNNIVEAGESLLLGFNLENVGTGDGGLVSISISSESELLEVIRGDASYNGIMVGETAILTDCFEIKIANDVPDQEIVELGYSISYNGNTYYYAYQIKINAPQLKLIAYQINDSGVINANNLLEPGESGELTIQIANAGHADSEEIYVELLSSNPGIIINNFNPIIVPLHAGEHATSSFEISVDETLESGSNEIFIVRMTSGEFLFISRISMYLGCPYEDFETGGFGELNWINMNLPAIGTYAWDVVSDNGTYCAKSSVPTGVNNAESNLSISIDVMMAGEMSFLRRVSSEPDRDYLEFLIDGQRQGIWWGEEPWSNHTYMLTRGPHTLTWRYQKNEANEAGDDCAWLDNIKFPPLNVTSGDAPMIDVDSYSVEFGEAIEGAVQQLTIRNIGTMPLVGSYALGYPFQIVKDTTELVNWEEFSIGTGTEKQVNIVFDHNYASRDSLIYRNFQILSNSPYHEQIDIPITIVVMDSDTSDSINKFAHRLIGNYPNPFNPETKISFYLASPQEARVEIFNLKGQKVKLIVRDCTSGYQSISWDGLMTSGSSGASGLYFYRLSVGGYTSTKKMLLLK